MPAQYALSRVRIGTVLLALFSTTIASHGQAATPDTNVWYRLVNRHSGQVLEVFEYSTADGGNVVQWPDLNGPNQQWRFASSGEGYYRLINRNSGKAMDVYGFSTEPGGNVVQWADLNGWNQQWATPDTGNGCQQPDPGTNRHSGEQWVGYLHRQSWRSKPAQPKCAYRQRLRRRNEQPRRWWISSMESHHDT